MKGFSRPLIYVLFVVVILYLFSLRAQRSETVVLAEAPLDFLVAKGSFSGEVVFKRRADGSEFLVVKLNARVPREVLVLLIGKEGVARELGRFQGATFLSTLPKGASFEDVTKIEIKFVDTGQVFAEARLKTKNP